MRAPLFRSNIAHYGAAALMVLAFLSPAIAEEPLYIVGAAEGQAAVLPEGAENAAPLKKGMPLLRGDRLLTGEGGRVEFSGKSGTVVRLEENTQVALGTGAGAETRFFVKIGRFLAKFQKAPRGDRYRVKTPVAVASVRGTELALAVDENGATDAGVVEGEVAFERAPGESEPAVLEEMPERPEPEERSIGAEEGHEQADAWTAGDVVIRASEGLRVDADKDPTKLPYIPPVLVESVAWFEHVRDTVPDLRKQWSRWEPGEGERLRREALRESLDWTVPAWDLDSLAPPGPGDSYRPPPRPGVPPLRDR